MGDFIRPALGSLQLSQAGRAAIPYQFGLIGSTDAPHRAVGAEEDNFWGKMAYDPFRPTRPAARSPIPSTGLGYGPRRALAAVWATENTRQGISMP